MMATPTNPAVLEELRQLREERDQARLEAARLGGGGGERTVADQGSFTVTEVPAFVHCSDAFCGGSEVQREVTAQLEVWTQPYGSRGGDGSYATLVENTSERVFFKDPDAYVCDECGKASLELSRQQRPKYKHVSGHAQDGLLKQIRGGVSSESVVEAAMKARSESTPESRAMAQAAESMAAMVAAMRAEAPDPEPPKARKKA